MYENYKKLLDIKNRCSREIFVMACSYIVDKGYDAVSKIEEKDIENIQGNGLMTQDFCQNLVRISKEIVDTASSGIEIIQFISTEDIFDLTYYSGRLSRRKLENIITERIKREDIFCLSKDRAKEMICSLYNLDADDLKLLLPNDAAEKFGV